MRAACKKLHLQSGVLNLLSFYSTLTGIHVCPVIPGIQTLPLCTSTFWVQKDFSMSTHCFTQKVHFTPNNRKGTCQSLCHCGMSVSNMINGTGNLDYSCEFKGYFRRYYKLCMYIPSLLKEVIPATQKWHCLKNQKQAISHKS